VRGRSRYWYCILMYSTCQADFWRIFECAASIFCAGGPIGVTACKGAFCATPSGSGLLLESVTQGRGGAPRPWALVFKAFEVRSVTALRARGDATSIAWN